MAFAQGKDSGQPIEIKRYVGLASIKVLAVNPTMDEWAKIMGSPLQKEFEYTSTKEDGTKQARVMLLIQPNKASTQDGIEPIIPISFWFTKVPIVGSKTGKYRIMDKYAQCAWATAEEIAAKKIPEYSNGPATIEPDYRKIVRGEEEFTNFLRAHLGIPEYRVYNSTTQSWEKNPYPAECEGRLDNIMKIFDGDFSEIKKILGYKKDNYSKMLFGVRTSDNGREYQEIFTELFLKNHSTNHTLFARRLKEQMDLGRYSTTYFGELNANGEVIIEPFRERVVKPTEFKETPVETPPVQTGETPDDDLPF